jgi:hypothetical protein
VGRKRETASGDFDKQDELLRRYSEGQLFFDQQKLFSYAFYETTYAVMVIIEIGAFGNLW